ncbi:MAG TPA: glycosyltransferase [Burkholderiales bacterium]|jgi:glycosyltransferase involved in cell wall biosynthesis|nr:glycosyltransferase [Burkholderiales bacterium]HEX2650046.1 glycosyltransferase [Burkholderiales bacterium]
MRKIALISEHASPLAATGGADAGGQNIYVAHVARQLARHGYLVDVFTRREEAAAPETVRTDDGYRVIHLRAGPARPIAKEKLLVHMGDFAEGLLRWFWRARAGGIPYELAHANFFMSGLAALAVKRAFGVPLVMTFHALGKVRRRHQREADGFPDARFEIEEMLVREADRIVAECPQDREDLIALYGARPRQIHTVPCGFDAGEFSPLERRFARAALRWDPNAFVILQLGRLVPRKGVDNVIDALGLLRGAEAPEPRLYVVGGDSDEPDEQATPEIARLRKIARDAGVEDQAVFVGRRERAVLRLYYAACDVFVTTPWYEPFGITPVEAMACARPVIGSRVGGIASTVVDGVTGYLVPPKDPAALAARLDALRRNPAEGEAMGRAGRARAASLYTWLGVARRLGVVYERALASKAPEARPARSALQVALQAGAAG